MRSRCGVSISVAPKQPKSPYPKSSAKSTMMLGRSSARQTPEKSSAAINKTFRIDLLSGPMQKGQGEKIRKKNHEDTKVTKKSNVILTWATLAVCSLCPL